MLLDNSCLTGKSKCWGICYSQKYKTLTAWINHCRNKKPQKFKTPDIGKNGRIRTSQKQLAIQYLGCLVTQPSDFFMFIEGMYRNFYIFPNIINSCNRKLNSLPYRTVKG